jgi:hypothetical protein
LIQFCRRSFQGFALEAYYYPAAASNKFMIQDTRGPNAHTTTTKDKMIELFTLQSHPKDLLNSSSSRKLSPSPLEQGIIEDNHINNKSWKGWKDKRTSVNIQLHRLPAFLWIVKTPKHSSSI